MLCRITGEQFEVSDAEKHLLQSIVAAHPLLSDPLPLPDIAPNEFMRQYMCWGNLLNLYKSKSSFSGKPQLSRYNPSLNYRICTPEEFWSLEIDNTEFGRPYDFTKPFFKQFDDLLKTAYLIPLTATKCEGSDYINGAFGTKHSYLSFGIFNSEDCMYSYMLHDCKDCVDCIDSLNSQYCYSCFFVRNCYECRYSQICTNCSECLFCADCIGCNNCILSFGLRNASFCIRNKPVTKEEYYKFVADLKLHSRSHVERAKIEFSNLLKSAQSSINTLINTENCSGHFISNCGNVHNSYYTHRARDCGNIMLSSECTNFWRGFAESADLGYQSGAHAKTYCCYNCYTDVGGSFNIYSIFTYNSCQHCFGSIGLNKKSYCILNKQYSKEEYFDLVPRIIAHMKSTNEWGKFFPACMAPHYYENSISEDWIESITLEEAARRGFRVGLIEELHSSEFKSADTLPESIFDVPDDITEHVFECPITRRPIKFQKKEINFYKRYEIPLPTIHWNKRIKSRISDVYLIPGSLGR